MYNNNVDLIDWTEKLEEEFLDFFRELTAKIKNHEEKAKHLVGITQGSICIEESNIKNLKEAVDSLTTSYICLNTSLTRLGAKIKFSKQIEATDFNTIKDSIINFESQLNTINEIIKDNLFKTKSEQFLLKIKSILFKIINFITDKGYARTAIIEHNVILLDGPKSYSTPIRTLSDRPQNSLFFARQINQELAKFKKQYSYSP